MNRAQQDLKNILYKKQQESWSSYLEYAPHIGTQKASIMQVIHVKIYMKNSL